MPIKYRRHGFREHVDSLLPESALRAGQPGVSFMRSQQLRMMLFMGIGIVTVLALFSGQLRAYFERTETTASARVTERIIRENNGITEFYITVQLNADGQQISESILLDEASWRNLEEGELIGIDYSMAPTDKRVTIQRLFTLTEP